MPAENEPTKRHTQFETLEATALIDDGDLLIYLDDLPEQLPRGMALVHNHALPTRRLDNLSDGFRAWLQLPEDDIERCDCGWAPQLGEHFRVRAVWEQATDAIKQQYRDHVAALQARSAPRRRRPAGIVVIEPVH